jgi:hypothetical protein
MQKTNGNLAFRDIYRVVDCTSLLCSVCRQPDALTCIQAWLLSQG